jgi:hypothetical protein
VDDRIVGVQHLDSATEQIFDFLEEVGYLTRTEVLPLEQVWIRWNGLQSDWALCETAIKRLRDQRGDPQIYEEWDALPRGIMARLIVRIQNGVLAGPVGVRPGLCEGRAGGCEGKARPLARWAGH